MNKIDASSQSPDPTSTSMPVAMTPALTEIESNFFFPRLISEIVPRIGEMMATMNNAMLSPAVQ